MLSTGGFALKANLDSLETSACYFAAGIHDVDHPAFNNAFLINTRDQLAIRYNDIAVLENHHIATAFKCAKAIQFFQQFSKEDYKKFRKLIIQMVLATDMSKHFSWIGKFRGKVDQEDETFAEQNKQLMFEMIMHACDISNPCKPWKICNQWALACIEEFFNQGDQEKQLGLPISQLMDRNTVNVAKSQIGFIDVIVLPTFEVFSFTLPKIKELLTNCKTNKKNWEELFEQHQQSVNTSNEMLINYSLKQFEKVSKE